MILFYEKIINNIDVTTEEMSKCIVAQAEDVNNINIKVSDISLSVDNTFVSVDILANSFEGVLDYNSQVNNVLK